MADPRRTHRQVLKFALGLPGAYEDHPWEETVAKVDGKVFVFLGSPDSPRWPAITVKLGESHEMALGFPDAEPTGYGLGRSGWVTIPIRVAGPPPGVLSDLVEESYRRVATKKRVMELDSSRR
ncbi:MAG TPA: MmcQ/YjbR family DNA-binding protein [Actinomycetota bacterium]|jgi:predicted DNA-binding protein (MmcQ/YjbR family)